jgi:hypothetical protein
MRSEGITAPFFTLMMELSGQFHAPVTLHLPSPHGKSPRYPLVRRLGRPQSLSGCCGEEKNPLPLPRSNLNSLAITIPSELGSDQTKWNLAARNVQNNIPVIIT